MGNGGYAMEFLKKIFVATLMFAFAMTVVSNTFAMESELDDSSNYDSDLMKSKQIYKQVTIIEKYTAQNSENVIQQWERTLLQENLNSQNQQYYKDNRLHMNELQHLEYLQQDNYTCHSEFQRLQNKYSEKNEKKSENSEQWMKLSWSDCSYFVVMFNKPSLASS